MDLTRLQIPLDVNFIDFRPAYIVKGKDSRIWCNLLAYKDARVDMNILDEVCGADWQVKYKRDSKGVLQCGIGIKVRTEAVDRKFNVETKEYEDMTIYEESEWVWRWSNGIESNNEAVKGEYSDAFKRAGFMAGGDKIKTTSRFKPNEWAWEVSEDYSKVEARDRDSIVRVSIK